VDASKQVERCADKWLFLIRGDIKEVQIAFSKTSKSKGPGWNIQDTACGVGKISQASISNRGRTGGCKRKGGATGRVKKLKKGTTGAITCRSDSSKPPKDHPRKKGALAKGVKVGEENPRPSVQKRCISKTLGPSPRGR